MDHETARYDEDDAETATLGMSVIDMIGTLLASAARFFNADAIRRFGGPGALRRIASIVAAFLAHAIALLVQRRAVAEHSIAASGSRRLSRHLSHPPAGWAAP